MDSKSVDPQTWTSRQFSKMPYELERKTETGIAVSKWLQSERAGVLSSIIEGKPITDATRNIELIFLEIAFKVQLVTGEIAFPLGASGKESTCHPHRLAQLLSIVEATSGQFAVAEAYATSVPINAVTKEDAREWASVDKSCPALKQITDQMKHGSRIIFIPLEYTTYMFKTILIAAAAAVQFDGPVTLCFFVKDDSSALLLLPALYLIDCVNKSFSDVTINTILYDKSMPESKVMRSKSLANRDVIVIGFREITGVNFVQGYINLANWQGYGYNFGVTNDADVEAAVSTISRCVWLSGVGVNHRCQSLVFVHQSLYQKLIDGLIKRIHSMTILPSRAKILSHADFVLRTMSKEEADCQEEIRRLGAKVVSRSDEFAGPTLVYDIGTSTNFVAMRKPGFGHNLVVIPCRTMGELHSLSNNLGHSGNLKIISNSVDILSEALGRTLACPYFLTFANLLIPSAGVSWAVCAAPSSDIKAASGSAKMEVKPGSNKEWTALSVSEKVGRVMKLNEGVSGATDLFQNHITYAYFKYHQKQNKCNNSIDNGTNGIVLANIGQSDDAILFVVGLLALRSNASVVALLNTEVSTATDKRIKELLPPGLIQMVKVASLEQANALAQNWEVTWIVNGGGFEIRAELIKAGEKSRALIISKADNLELLNGARIFTDQLSGTV